MLGTLSSNVTWRPIGSIVLDLFFRNFRAPRSELYACRRPSRCGGRHLRGLVSIVTAWNDYSKLTSQASVS